MKKFVAVVVLLFASLLPALAQSATPVVQRPDCFVPFIITTTTSGASASFDNRPNSTAANGCVFWQISYANDGFSALSLIVETAPTSGDAAGSWSTFTAVSGSNPNTSTSNASSTFGTATSYFPFLRVQLTSATGTGTIKGALYGWRIQSPAIAASGSFSGTVVGPAADGAAVSGNPVRIGYRDTSGNTQDALSDTAGMPAMLRTAADTDGISNALGGMFISQTGSVGLARIVMYGANGASGTLDRVKTASLSNFPTATTTTSRNSTGAIQVADQSEWSVVSTPAANSQATASIAAEASVRHVLRKVCFSATSNASVTAANGTLDIRDGATGAGTVIAQFRVAIPTAAAAGVQIVPPFCTPDLNLVGTTNTAMTAEFSAGVTGATQSVTMTGFNVN